MIPVTMTLLTGITVGTSNTETEPTNVTLDHTMKTTFRMCEKRCAWTNCSTISPDDRLFLKPIVPVAQNLQPILQPTLKNSKSIKLMIWQKITYLRNHQLKPKTFIVNLIIVLVKSKETLHAQKHRIRFYLR